MDSNLCINLALSACNEPKFTKLLTSASGFMLLILILVL